MQLNIGSLHMHEKSGNCLIFCEVNQLKIEDKANIMTSMRCRVTINTASGSTWVAKIATNYEGGYINGKLEAESHLQDLLWQCYRCFRLLPGYRG